ncbi:MAG: hypothetical protein PW786_03070 [Arachidicoccus sp.]|nr:hypothetical protein [Arachidicoccus sp.]
MKRVYFSIICIAAFLFVKCKNQETNSLLLEKQKEVKSLVSSLLLYPDSAGLRVIIANKSDSIGDYKSALLQLDTLLQNDSTKYGLWATKANIFQDSGNIAEAKYYLYKAISIYPGNEALMSLSEMLANEKNDSCLLIAKRFNDQSNAYADYISALYFYNKNDLQKADSSAGKSILHNHDFVKPYLLKANILQHKNNTNEALQLMKEALLIEPKNIALLNETANIYTQYNRRDSAAIYFNQSLAIQPYQPKISEKLKLLK